MITAHWMTEIACLGVIVAAAVAVALLVIELYDRRAERASADRREVERLYLAGGWDEHCATAGISDTPIHDAVTREFVDAALWELELDLDRLTEDDR